MSNYSGAGYLPDLQGPQVIGLLPRVGGMDEQLLSGSFQAAGPSLRRGACSSRSFSASTLFA